MNYSLIREMDVTNGPGIRVTLFVSGCTHNCNGCFNKEQQDFNNGELFTKETEDLFISYVKNDIVVGVNILGGEPLQQDITLYSLLKRIKRETNKSIWLWTGYTLDTIPVNKLSILDYIDVLIDGRFELDKRDLKLKYRGSKNQNVYDKVNNEFILKNVDN